RQHAAPTQFQLTFLISFPIPFACFFSPRRRRLGASEPPLPPHPQESQPARNNPLLRAATRRGGQATSLSLYSDGGTAPGSWFLFPPQFDSVVRRRRRRSGKGSHRPAVHAARDGVPAPPRNAGFSAAKTLGTCVRQIPLFFRSAAAVVRCSPNVGAPDFL
uniref:Uncharacterized protein n=1 Tax=Aegilops tauschii subsp. strangulata TaxID=200361 RepID=A0A452ZS30_AEGTS